MPGKLRSKRKPHWAALSDEDLLRTRIKDLGLTIEGTPLEARVRAFRRESRKKGIGIHPVVYLGDEWFSTEGEISISVPFYLAHPRLQALEQRMTGEVEGRSPGHFRRLLRHELGHCFDHAHRVSRTRRWRKLFGDPGEEYAPESYHPNPASRAHVRNLPGHYAQAHPDEDFAETFAVWLGSGTSRALLSRYSRWPVARTKLRYVEGLARKLGLKPPARGVLPRPGGGHCRADRMGITLGEYYIRRKRVEQKAKAREKRLAKRASESSS